MPAGDNPHSISEKKAALRESPKEPKSIVNQQLGTSPVPKDKGLCQEPAEILGTKRPQPNGPASPTNYHTLGSSSTNGHLVYVRRKLETEQGKVGTSATTESISSPDSKKVVRGGPKEPTLKHQNNGPHVPSPVNASSAAASPAMPSGGSLPHHSFGMRSPGKAVAQPSNVVATSLKPCIVVATSPTRHPADLPRSSNQDWKERYIRLQALLKNIEQSGQEEHICRLRSLSAVGRSKHAIELEKRAVNLLIEEGKELHKMKVLNVLGKLSPTDPPPLPAQPSSPLQPPFRQ